MKPSTSDTVFTHCCLYVHTEPFVSMYYLIVILLYTISASFRQNYTWKFSPMSLKTLGQPHHHCEVEPRSLCVLGTLPPSCLPSSILNLILSIFSCLRHYFLFSVVTLYSVYMYCTTYVPDIQRAQKRALDSLEQELQMFVTCGYQELNLGLL